MAESRGGRRRHSEDGGVRQGSQDLKLIHPPKTAHTEQARALGSQCHLQWILAESPLLMSATHSIADTLPMGLHFLNPGSSFFYAGN